MNAASCLRPARPRAEDMFRIGSPAETRRPAGAFSTATIRPLHCTVACNAKGGPDDAPQTHPLALQRQAPAQGEKAVITRSLEPWDPMVHRGRIEHDCEYRLGIPDCWGSCIRGPEGCTCRSLPPEQHVQAEQEARVAAILRRGKACKSCFFRSRKLDDSVDIRRLAESPDPPACHVAVPLNAIGGEAGPDSFAPRFGAVYPTCDGWRRAREKLIESKRRRLRLVPRATGGSSEPGR